MTLPLRLTKALKIPRAWVAKTLIPAARVGSAVQRMSARLVVQHLIPRATRRIEPAAAPGNGRKRLTIFRWSVTGQLEVYYSNQMPKPYLEISQVGYHRNWYQSNRYLVLGVPNSED
jgi:hypothetical protein